MLVGKRQICPTSGTPRPYDSLQASASPNSLLAIGVTSIVTITWAPLSSI